MKTKVTDIVADAANLPFKDCWVDYIYSRRCIQHIRNDMQALKEMYRVLKLHGRLKLIVASFYGYLFYVLRLSESSGKYGVFHLYFSHKLKRMLKQTGFIDIYREN